jgi:hypothetical protein
VHFQVFKSKIDEMREAIHVNRARKPYISPFLAQGSGGSSKKARKRKASEEKTATLLVSTSNTSNHGSSTPV